MYRLKIRPHQHNRYLYNATIYERAYFLGIGYWKFYNSNEALPDWGLGEHIKECLNDLKFVRFDIKRDDISILIHDYERTIFKSQGNRRRI